MQDELLAAIVAAPDDDAPRLVYADWLAQQGDPMGELIVLQCRLAAGDATPEIAARERELRAALEPRWLAPVQAIAPGGFAMRRGFVEHAELFRAEVPDELFARAPLVRSIGVRGAIVHHEPPAVLARIDALALNELGAYDNELAPALAAFFASPHLARLRRLELVRARLDADALAAIADVPCPLEHLRVDVTYPYEPFSIDGAGLAARFAGRAVHSLELVGFEKRRGRARPAPPRELAFDAEFADYKARDQLIPAIKRYRELSSAGLAEAKTAVERLFGRT